MTRTASKETVGECRVCDGQGETRVTVQEGKTKDFTYWRKGGYVCTHCKGSGIRPQRVICTDCQGIGGHATGHGLTHQNHRCKTCDGNGWTLLRLRDGQQFESQEVLP